MPDFHKTHLQHSDDHTIEQSMRLTCDTCENACLSSKHNSALHSILGSVLDVTLKGMHVQAKHDWVPMTLVFHTDRVFGFTDEVPQKVARCPQLTTESLFEHSFESSFLKT